jgi:hypothetical protein
MVSCENVFVLTGFNMPFLSRINASLSSYWSQPPRSLNFSSSDILQRIREAALAAFLKLDTFLSSFKRQSSEGNMKTFALISCPFLIALMIISMLRKRKPPTSHPQI